MEQIPWLYDACCWALERFGLGRWRRWLMGGAAGRTLEIGCGTGRNLVLPCDATFIVGVDPSPDALARAHRRAPGVCLVRASAHDLPFRADSFDTVIGALVFCSVPDPGRGLQETKRVLAPTGTVRMIEHVRSTTRWRARLQDIIQPTWTWAAGGCHPNRDTEAAVARAGFEIDPKSVRARGSMRRFVATSARHQASYTLHRD